MGQVKEKYQVPVELQSCHTAVVNGYIVEGHVPVAEIERLLAEQPEALGIAVPGMPVGSPGMEDGTGNIQPYDVVLFDEGGVIEVYASYP
jgi:hypothetical protein